MRLQAHPRMLRICSAALALQCSICRDGWIRECSNVGSRHIPACFPYVAPRLPFSVPSAEMGGCESAARWAAVPSRHASHEAPCPCASVHHLQPRVQGDGVREQRQRQRLRLHYRAGCRQTIGCSTTVHVTQCSASVYVGCRAAAAPTQPLKTHPGSCRCRTARPAPL